MNRQRLIMCILLAVFALTATWSYFAYPRQQRAGRPTAAAPVQRRLSSAAVPPKAPAAAAVAANVLNLALLDAEQPAFKGYRHNIFRPIFQDEFKVVRQKASALKPPVLPPPVKPTPPPATERPTLMPEVSQRDLARFRFLGFLKRDNQKIIFLGRDKDILLVKEGDRFAGRYEAVAITDQALTIIVKDTGDEIVIPLIENKPLVSAK